MVAHCEEPTAPAPGALSRRQVIRGALAAGTGALAASVLAACGSDDKDKAKTTGGGSPAAGGAVPAGTAAPFTRQASITEWGFGVEETNPRAFSRVEAFKQKYPNIKLEIVPKFDDQKLLTAAASKQLPDLLWLGRSDLSSWAARGVLRPLDEYIQKEKYDTDRFYDAALQEVKYDGKTYGLPQFMTVGALYVNLDAVKEIGVDGKQLDTGNWDRLTDYSRQLVKRTGDKIDRWGFDNKIQPQALWLWLWGLANEGTFISQDGKKVSFNEPKIVEALEFGIKNYQAQGGYQAYQAAATTWQADEQFARGQVAITLYENWMLGIIARVAPDLNFAVLPMTRRNSKDWISTTGGNAWVITSGAKEPEAAWEFIKFMNEDETWLIAENAQKDFQKKNNRPYTPTLTANKRADRLGIDRVYEPIQPKFDDAIRLFPQLLEKSQKSPVSTSPVSKQLTDVLKNEGVKPAFEGERSAKEALDRATQRGQTEVDSFRP